MSPMGSASALASAAAYVPAIGAVQRWFVTPPRLCLRPRGQRHRRRHAGDAAAWRAADRGLGLARRLSRARRPRRRRRRRHGAPDRERSARPRPWARRRSAAIGAPREHGRRRLGRRGDPIAPLHRPLRRLPDLLVRRVRAVRPSRALCARSRHRAVLGGAAAGRDRRRQHRRALLPRRPGRPDGPPALAAR